MGKINTDNYPNRPFSSYQDDDMFILQDNGGETHTTNVGDIKNLADSRIKLEGVQVNGTDLPISNKKVNVDISGKTDLSVIAYTFNSEMGYFKGAYVTYNGKLYEFIQEHTGAWNPSHVREIRASGQYVRTGNGGYNNGDRATCEGYMTKASGNYSHAEGRETQAVGDCTHAEGIGTIANSIYQHVEGKYNVADNESKYIHIIGNGIDANNRNNAFAIDWDGNLEVSGEVEDGNGEKISDKADKVTNATSGHLAGLDANGNLTDSGVSPTEDVTVEGNPVTFDSPFEQDAKSVVVSVKPIQDLHGYDHPWVGGAGKNKAQNNMSTITMADVTWTKNDDGTITVSGTPSNNSYITNAFIAKVSASIGNVTFSGLNGVSNITCETLYLKDINDVTLASFQPGTSNYTVDLSNYADVDYITATYKRISDGVACSGTIKPQIEAGSQTTTWTPYSNICPISGIDEVEIEVTGKNHGILDASHIQSTYGQQNSTVTYANNGVIVTSTGNYGRCGFEVPVQKGKTYTISMKAKKSDSTGGGGILYGSSPMWDAEYGAVRDNGISTSFTTLTKTITAESDTLYIGIYPLVSGVSLTVEDFMVEVGEQATDFVPFKGLTETTIPLPSTLYDADVDVTEGDGTNNGGFAVFDGSEDEDWQMYGSGSASAFAMKIALPSTAKNFGTTPYINTNELQTVSVLNPWGDYDAFISQESASTTNRGYIICGVKNVSTSVEAWKSFLAEHPLQVAYELATPTTISFDPADVELLEGTNVVSTNGEKVAVKYGRSLWQDIDDLKTDTEGKLDKSDVATIEGDTASKAYSVNDFMLRSDGFYRVTAPIAQNASITSSNTTKTTIGAVLTALLNS